MMNTPDDRGSIGVGEWVVRAPGAMRGCQRMVLATAASFPVATPNAPLTFLRMFAGLPNHASPAAVHLLPALLVVLAGAPVVVPASASLAPIANGHQRLVASLALGLSRLPGPTSDFGDAHPFRLPAVGASCPRWLATPRSPPRPRGGENRAGGERVPPPPLSRTISYPARKIPGSVEPAPIAAIRCAMAVPPRLARKMSVFFVDPSAPWAPGQIAAGRGPCPGGRCCKLAQLVTGSSRAVNN